MPTEAATPRVVVYVGYHKTATKWLWKHFFTRHYPCRQVNLFDQDTLDTLRATVRANGSPFILRQRLESGLMGGALSDVVETISGAFPEARVVAAIRSQRSMPPSHYGQYVTNGGRLGFAAYLDETVKVKWHYHRVLEHFQERFPDRLFVYLFEELRDDPFALLRRLRDFVGAPDGGLAGEELRRIAALPPMNPQRNDLVIDTMLLLNRLRMRHEKNRIIPEIRRPGQDHILVEVAEVIARFYAARFGRPLRYRRFDDRGVLDRAYGAENQALSALLDRPLRDYGYPG